VEQVYIYIPYFSDSADIDHNSVRIFSSLDEAMHYRQVMSTKLGHCNSEIIESTYNPKAIYLTNLKE
jgi:hypothetical protein